MSDPAAAPELSLCVVNWNGAEHLPRLLASVEAAAGSLRVEVVVVDNASTDGSADGIAAEAPRVRLVRNAENLGYARACEQARALARAPLLLFLNNDLVLAPGSLERLVAALRADPGAVAAGPRLRWPDGRVQESTGGLPDLRALLHRVSWVRWTGLCRAAYRRFRHAHADRTGPCQRLAGAALLVRADALPPGEPLWDSGYPFGLQDVDLCRRLGRAGRLLHVVEAEAVHAGSASSERNPAFVLEGYERGFVRYLERHDPRPWAPWAYRAAVTLDLPWRFLGAVLRALRLRCAGRTEDAARARARAAALLRFAARGLPDYWGRFAWGFAWLWLAGLLLRLGSALRAPVIARDGIGYLESAGLLLRGEWRAALAYYYPPGYPSWLALWGLPAGALGEELAEVASAVSSSLVVPCAALLGRRLGGRAAGLYAGLLAALLPLWVELGGQVLSEALHLSLLAGATCCLARAFAARGTARSSAAAGGALLVWAYLTRPEGIVVLGVAAACALFAPRARSWRARLADVGWLFAPALALGLPFLLYIQGVDTRIGTGGGRFKLTLKQDMLLVLSQLEAGPYVAKLFDQLRLWLKALGPGLPLVALAVGAALRRRPWRGPRASLGFFCGLSALGLWGTFAVVRAERRYAAQLAVFSLPAAGVGALLVLRWLRRRCARPALVVALFLALPCLPFALATPHRRKASYRDAGALLAAHGCRRVLARDSRAAWYAGAESLAFLFYFPRGVPPGAREVLDVARRERADAVVLVVRDERGRRLSRDLARLAGRRPLEVRRPGALPLDLYVLHEAAESPPPQPAPGRGG